MRSQLLRCMSPFMALRARSADGRGARPKKDKGQK
jgi:hypothetical protein